jgi:O-acetyl-ADP-ribose deacetylase (regulator of RNase III)
LSDVVKFGLKDLCNNDESTITNDDIEEILKKGKIVEETEHLKRLDKSTEGLFIREGEEADNPYLFEGRDYSKDAQSHDQEAFESLRQKDTTVLTNESNRDGYGASLKEIENETRSESRQKRASVSKEEIELRKKQKREDKWKEVGYTSLAVTILENEWENLGTDEEMESKTKKEENDWKDVVDEGDLNDLYEVESRQNDQDNEYLHFVTGDATKPQCTSPAAIIVNCLDNSGQWGRGGFFNAISALSVLPEQNYAMAHKMGDLKLGDVHLVPIVSQASSEHEQRTKTQPHPQTKTENGDINITQSANVDESLSGTGRTIVSKEQRPLQLYVANVICQSRKSGSISPINMLKLQEALKKIAVVAKKLNASVHLPRIGAHLPTTDWYSVERLIRVCIASKKIETTIYYFPRKKRFEKKQGETQHSIKSEPLQWTSNRNISKEDRKPNDNFFSGLCFHFYLVGDKLHSLQRAVTSHGGNYTFVITENTTHVVTSLTRPDELLSLCIKPFPTVKLVSFRFIDDCITHQKLLDDKNYIIPR